MSLEQLLRQENYHLKNQITDLKNVFDINREILRLIAHHDNPNDHQHRLLIQIITKLTSINNQALLSNLQLTQEKALLKEENLKVNMQLNSLQKKYVLEVEALRNSHHSPEAHYSSQETSVSQQGQAQSKLKTADTLQRSNNLLPTESTTKIMLENHAEITARFRRKYTETECIMLEQGLEQARKEIRTLKRHTQELEYRLMVLLKAFKLEEEAEKIRPSRMIKEIGESQLIKYALNDIRVVKKNDKQTIKIHNRIGSKRQPTQSIKRESNSWPKHKDFTISVQPTQKSSQRSSQKS